MTGTHGVGVPDSDGDRAGLDPGLPGANGLTTPLPGRRAAGPGVPDGAEGVGADGAGRPGGPGDTGGAGGPGGAGRAGGGSRRKPAAGRGKTKARRRLSWWVELVVLFVFALSIMLVIKTYVVQAFYIPSSSMENTLDIGDKVLVNKLVYHFRPIARGDVVVFNGEGSWDPPTPASSGDPVVRIASEFGHAVVGLFGISPGVHDYIKRVIGLPGDRVACCDAQGRVTVDGVPLNEKSYLYPGNVPSQTRFSITVPPGRLWVMGDHRDVSYDSRGHIGDPGGGSIPESQVVGRAFTILWPTSRFRVLPIPSTFNHLNAAHSALGALAVPYAPVTAAAFMAVPLTWLDRRLRRRRRGRTVGRVRFGAAGGRRGRAAGRRWRAAAAGRRWRPWRTLMGRRPRGRGGMRRMAGRWPGFRPGRW